MTDSPYLRAMLRTRKLMGILEPRAAIRVQAALEAYGRALEAAVRDLGSDYARHSLDAIRAAARRLDLELADAVGSQRGLAFDRSLEVWRESMRQVASLRGVSGALMGRVAVSPITLLNHYATLQGGVHWRTLIRTNAISSAQEANQILIMAAQEGVGPEEVARRLRKYVTGSEDFQGLFTKVPTKSGEVAKLDLRKLPKELRGASRQMVNSSRRIAFSELHNARAEAEVQHLLADPFVAYARWTLSPVRSTVGWMPPCECDYLAGNDLYGLGPGAYPISSWPRPPHPLDRCEKTPITRPTSELKEPKPQGVQPSQEHVLSGGFVPNGDRLSPKGAQRLRERAWSAIDFGIQGRPGAGG